MLSIIGSSGGGKTTLLRCLNFLESANSGEIVVNGKTVFSKEEGEKVNVSPEAQLSFGLGFQQFNLFPQYSVIDNLMLDIISGHRLYRPDFRCQNCSISVFEYQNDRWRVNLWNDTGEIG